MSNKTKKLLLLNLPYFIAGLICTNLGEAWRIAEGADMSEKLLGFLSAQGTAFSNPTPSLHPMDLLIGVCCGAGLRLAVYLKGKNAKKYRHGMEYGSARWGTQKDIEPFEDPVFANNVILNRTERLMMGNRPKNPANARNKNVLVVGGSGSGKTRFWLKPNLLQCHSSYVVTDLKGDIVIDCGQALLKNGYSIRIFNTINFRKSMHYNPFAYIHSEKDILKLTTTLIANTKGDGKAGDEFWTKAETLLYLMQSGMSSEDETESSTALTPDGNMTLVDDIGEEEDKSSQQFITLVTKAGNTFYLIIDRDKDGNQNVHFLNMVDEADLLALMDEGQAAKYQEKEPEVTEPAETKKPQETEPAPEEQKTESKEKKDSPLPMIMLLLFVIGAAGVGGYLYIKMKGVKPASKKNQPDPDADYHDEDEDTLQLPEDDGDEDEEVDVNEDYEAESDDEPV